MHFRIHKTNNPLFKVEYVPGLEIFSPPRIRSVTGPSTHSQSAPWPSTPATAGASVQPEETVEEDQHPNQEKQK